MDFVKNSGETIRRSLELVEVHNFAIAAVSKHKRVFFIIQQEFSGA